MDIIKLTKEHHDLVLKLFGPDAADYYFLINELIDHHYEGPSFHAYGEYEDGQLYSLLLNNFNNVTYYSRTDRGISGYQGVLNRLTYSKLSGPSRWMKKFMPLVKVRSDSLSHMGVVRRIQARRKYPELKLHTISSEEEAGKHYDLLSSTKEYEMTATRDDYIKTEMKRLRETSDRTVYLSLDGRMISSCGTVRESRNSAIVIGVVTHPEYRNQGYGSEVLIGLFESLLQEGKFPYLFYSNPAARRVYKNIGMIEVCEWRVAMVEPHQPLRLPDSDVRA